jgi:putative tricarboxylic transport membrane protein
MYGGSTTAIVMNIPGEARPWPRPWTATNWPNRVERAALPISAISSWWPLTIASSGLTFFAPSWPALPCLWPARVLRLMFMGLSLIISLSGKALFKGIIARPSAC